MQSLPMADAALTEKAKQQIMRTVADRQLVGAANNVKWNKLLTHMREREDWVPSYRWKSVEGYISGWDVEWHYHLPFPFVGVEWFDIGVHQTIPVGRLVDDKIIDHSVWIVPLLESIRFDFEKKSDVVRIWGYLPKCYEDFPPKD